MMNEPRYLYKYDNPYTILAHYIVGFYRPADVLRCLTDNAYLATLIQKEVRDLDLRGHFLDCIVEDVLFKKGRMEMMHELDVLGKYFYTKLDKERLRKELLETLAESGVVIQLEEETPQPSRS